MANALYPLAKQSFLKADLDLDSEVRVILVDLADYTYNTAHDMLDDVPAGARVAVSAAVASKTFINGTFDHADFTFTAVSGDPSEALIWYQHTGTESTSRLICFMDTGVTGLPVTPNGGDINVTVSASGVFSL